MFAKGKADCPFWRGPCKEHACRLYIQVMGQHPSTGEKISQFGCSFEFLPMLLIENAQQSRQTGAAVESFRNEMVNANGIAAIQQQIMQSMEALPSIEDKR